jgi:Ca-activated chloride channel homolog
VRIDCSEGVRPVRLLGREGDVAGQQAVVSLNQVYSDQTKYALLEMELPAREAGTEIHAATVRVSYASMASGATNQWAGHLSASYTDSPALVQEAVNKDVMASAVHQIAVERNRLALRLRDEGDVGKARALLEQNWGYLRDNAARLNNEQLLDYGYSNQAAIENLDEKNWTRQRKVMREEQFQIMQQQAN